MRKLGPELGLSDVGLLKLCRRHDIPTPGLGYWAKKEAGRAPPQTPLPTTPHDPEVLTLDGSGHRHVSLPQRVDLVARRTKTVTVSPASVGVPATLEGCHAIVAKTAKYFETVKRALAREAQQRTTAARTWSPDWTGLAVRFDKRPTRTTFGRFTCEQPGCLRIAAMLDSVDWILRFHEALLVALEPSGCRLGARADGRGLRISKGREGVTVSFIEQVDPVPSKTPSLVGEFKSRGKFKLTLTREVGGSRDWVGAAAELEILLPKIVAVLAAAPDEQARRRVIFNEEKEAQEERWRAEQARQEQRSREIREQLARREARLAQFKRAEDVARLVDDHERVLVLLAELERRMPEEPGKREVLTTWLGLIRGGMRDPVDTLIAAITAEGTKDTPPLWWPAAPDVADA